MPTLIARLLLSLTLAPAQEPPKAPLESVAVYGLVAKNAVELLPDPLKQHLDGQLRTIIHRAEAAFRDDPAAHFVSLAPNDDSAAAPPTAAAEVQNDAPVCHPALCKLPSLLVEKKEQLESSFRQSADDIAALVGEVVHLSTDVCMPFRSNPGPHLRDPARRIEVDLISRAYPRLEYEVRISPQRLSRTDNPMRDALTAARDAWRDGQTLIELQKEIEGSRPNSVAGADADLRAAAFLEQALPILETRIECGALLAARIIAQAWMDAGSPKLAGDSSVPSNVEKPTTGYVGSANSKTFHKLSCVHAARIKPENRIAFATLAQARSAGRKPCRACKPE